MLLSFHYLVSTFFLAVWWQSISWILLAYYFFQTVYFLSGGVVSDPTLFWGYQSLIALLGTLAGNWIGNKPLLIWHNAYSWLYFIFSAAAWTGAQLLYAYYPPFPGFPAGQQGLGLTCTTVLHFFIIIFIWYGVSRTHKDHEYLFPRWLVFTFLIELPFFVALSGWDERWVAITIGGSIALLAVISHLWRQKNGYFGPRPMVRRPLI